MVALMIFKIIDPPGKNIAPTHVTIADAIAKPNSNYCLLHVPALAHPFDTKLQSVIPISEQLDSYFSSH